MQKVDGMMFYLADFILILFITDVEAENAAVVELQLPGRQASLSWQPDPRLVGHASFRL